MKRVINKIIIIIGLILLIVGGIFAVMGLTKALNIVEYNETLDTDKQVLVNGKLSLVEDAYDDEFDITVNSPVLIRNVDMVQWYKDDTGVRMVLANFPIPSFQSDGTTYTNPDFPSNVNSKVFYGKAYIGDNKDLLIGDEILNVLALNNYQYFSNEIQKLQLTDLPENNGNKYNLVLVDNAYVTASDEWQLGEIKVTYKYVDTDNLPSLTAVGNVREENGIKKMIFNNESTLLFDKEMSLKEVRNIVTGNMIPYYALIGGGVLLVILGLVIKQKRK